MLPCDWYRRSSQCPERQSHIRKNLHDQTRTPFRQSDQWFRGQIGLEPLRAHEGFVPRLSVNVLSEVSCCYSLQAIITCLVCDGGPSEQAAVPLLQRDLFPNATMVSRDRAHRARSITKGVWGPLNEQCQGLLGLFTTDDQSISRMLQKLGLFANSVVTELLLNVLNPSLLILIASAKELQQILPDISRDSDQQRCQIHQSIEKFLFRFTAIQLIVRSPFQTVPLAS